MIVQGPNALLRRLLMQRFLVEIFVLVGFIVHDTTVTHYAFVIHSKLVLGVLLIRKEALRVRYRRSRLLLVLNEVLIVYITSTAAVVRIV